MAKFLFHHTPLLKRRAQTEARKEGISLSAFVARSLCSAVGLPYEPLKVGRPPKKKRKVKT